MRTVLARVVLAASDYETPQPGYWLRFNLDWPPSERKFHEAVTSALAMPAALEVCSYEARYHAAQGEVRGS